MSKLILGILVAGIFFTSIVFAQQMQDVIYLKNGTVIHGTIIEQIPGVSMKIQTKDGNIFVFKTEEIEKITKEPTTQISGAKIQGFKSPGLAFALSFLVVGLGQHYNGEYTKGIIQEALVLGGLVLFWTTWDDVYYYDWYYVEWYYEGEEPTTLSWIGLGAASAVSLWSMIDAPISASRINKEQGYGHLMEFNKDKYALGLDVGLTKKGVGAKVTLHF